MLHLATYSIPMKAERGLLFDAGAYALRRETLRIPAKAAPDPDFVALVAGGEATVVVTVPGGLAPNADIKSVKATLTVKGIDTEDATAARVAALADREQQAQIKQTARVTKNGQTTTYDVTIDVPESPNNLALRLDQGDIFWTGSANRQRRTFEIPDFAQHLNAFLDKWPAGETPVTLRFLVGSDARGWVKLEIAEAPVWKLIQTETWPNPLDDTIRLDRNLSMTYGQVERLPLTFIGETNVGRFTFTEIRMDVRGSFGPGRLLGSLDLRRRREFATVSGDYALAQRFVLPTAVQCSGVAGCFFADAEVEVYVEIQKDEDGSPAALDPLAHATVSMGPQEVSDGTWTHVPFETSVELEPAVLYWLVVKGVQGTSRLGLADKAAERLFELSWPSFAALNADAVLRTVVPQFAKHAAPLSQRISVLMTETDTEGMIVDEERKSLYVVRRRGERLEIAGSEYLCGLRINRGGQLWKDVTPGHSDPPVGLLRLIYVPEPDNWTASLEIGLEGVEQYQRHEPEAETKTVCLPGPERMEPATLAIRSYAQGEVNIANVVQEYGPKEETRPLSAGKGRVP